MRRGRCYTVEQLIGDLPNSHIPPFLLGLGNLGWQKVTGILKKEGQKKGKQNKAGKKEAKKKEQRRDGKACITSSPLPCPHRLLPSVIDWREVLSWEQGERHQL